MTLSDPQKALLDVAQFLGVELNPGDRIIVPTIHKQAETDAKAWARRFERGTDKTLS